MTAVPQLFNYVDGISVHFYQANQNTPPENRIAGFQQVQRIIQPYIPNGKTVPVICSEWGVSTLNAGAVNETNQAWFDVRAWLTNIALGLPVSVCYAFNSLDQYNNPDGFGIVNNPSTGNYKPAFVALYTTTNILSGYFYEGTSSGYAQGDYVYKFYNPGSQTWILVVWTSGNAHYVNVALSGNVYVKDYLGTQRTVSPNGANSIPIYMNGGPQYIYVPYGESVPN